MIEFNCDVHKWMRGYAIVHSNPYLAVSDAKGQIALEEIPPGEYPYVAWHEKLGTVTQQITVTAEQATLEVPAFELGKK